MVSQLKQKFQQEESSRVLETPQSEFLSIPTDIDQVKPTKMKSMLIYTYALIVLAWNSSIASAYPSTYSIDRIDRDVRDLKYIDSVSDYRNSRLRRAYYYENDNDDDTYGYYPDESERTPIRRQDSDDDGIAYKYTPLVRYRAQRTERKKLFVPNLWG